jgi:4-hydroxy-4-methyl-2-oxoglutarate aldolase
MRTGKGRIRLKALQVPVMIGNARVCPGDIIRGDADGVVVLPQAQVSQLLDIAEDITQKESRLRDDIRKGVRLDEARQRYDYHELQSPDYDK